MSEPAMRQITADVTRCCAAVYSSELATLLLGDTWHPGGLDLTRRLGQLAGLTPESHVLDVASGVGTSAIAIAEEFGCTVTGVDASEQNAAHATERAGESEVAARIRFVTGDANRLAFPPGSFDVVLCECALCTFADQAGAVREFARVLRPGGRVGISDVTRHGPLPPELNTLLSRIACIAGALPVDAYVRMLETAGFMVTETEEHGAALRDVVERIRQRIVGAQLLTRLHQLEIPGVDLEQAAALARLAVSSVRHGRLGYSLLVAQNPNIRSDS
ncbi:MAG TPA: methyltransferase domain-containing protein [Nitrolancea sp.]|nr:methyltransferase domain-containing protein [Nitrolancea sp.]